MSDEITGRQSLVDKIRTAQYLYAPTAHLPIRFDAFDKADYYEKNATFLD
jgi:hypothetical protein